MSAPQISPSKKAEVDAFMQRMNEAFALRNKNPAFALLKGKIESCDLTTGTVVATFQGEPSFSNGRAGQMQGGFTTAMLDAALGVYPTLLTLGEFALLTMEQKVSFYKSAPLGPRLKVVCTAPVFSVKSGVGMLEAEMFLESDTEHKTPLAKATQTAMLVKLNAAQSKQMAKL